VKAAGQRFIRCRSGEVARLYTVTDVHVGNAGCAEDSFARYVERIAADPSARWIGLGDYVDAIGFRDRRFDAGDLPDWLRARDLGKLGAVLFSRFVDFVAPIKAKCVGMGWGNHEWQMLHDTDSAERWGALLHSLGDPPDLGTSSTFDLVYCLGQARHQFRVATHHGGSSAQMPGGKLNSMRRLATENYPRADIVLSGHIHEMLDTDVVGVDGNADCSAIVDLTRLAVSCGTWLRAYTQDHAGYAERRAMRPTALGNAVITIQPESRRLGVERAR
jgi:hypothetical protein